MTEQKSMQGSFSWHKNKVMERFTVLTISSKVTYSNFYKTGFWPPAEVMCFYSLDWSEHRDFQKKQVFFYLNSEPMRRFWLTTETSPPALALRCTFFPHISMEFLNKKWKYNTLRYRITRIFLIDIWNSFKMLPWLLTLKFHTWVIVLPTHDTRQPQILLSNSQKTDGYSQRGCVQIIIFYRKLPLFPSEPVCIQSCPWSQGQKHLSKDEDLDVNCVLLGRKKEMDYGNLKFLISEAIWLLQENNQMQGL